MSSKVLLLLFKLFLIMFTYRSLQKWINFRNISTMFQLCGSLNQPIAKIFGIGLIHPLVPHVLSVLDGVNKNSAISCCSWCLRCSRGAKWSLGCLHLLVGEKMKDVFFLSKSEKKNSPSGKLAWHAEKFTFSIENTSSKGPCSIAMILWYFSWQVRNSTFPVLQNRMLTSLCSGIFWGWLLCHYIWEGG